MSKASFTKEQQKQLRESKYIQTVGDHYVKFTNAFWEEFGRRYLAGEDRYTICRSMGIEPDILGFKRLEYICRTIRSSQNLPPEKCRRPSANANYSEMSQDEAIKAMETELIYLRQEVEFLKKISQLEKEKKQSK